MKRRSISERFRKAGSLKVKREIALEWAKEWRARHDDDLRNAGKALRAGDAERAINALSELAGDDAKRFDALERLIEILSEEDAI